MKTAISIPDTLFKQAEKTAKKLGISRSNLYSRALEEYLKTHNPLKVTEQLNKIYGDCDQNSQIDDSMINMQSQSLEKEDW